MKRCGVLTPHRQQQQLQLGGGQEGSASLLAGNGGGHNEPKANRARQVNETIATLIVNWLNHLNLIEEKVKTLSELGDGRLLFLIVKEIIKSSEQLTDEFPTLAADNGQASADELDNANGYFDMIKLFLAHYSQINNNLDYEKAKNGCQWELAKLAFALLMNGLSREVSIFSSSSDALDEFEYQAIDNFFNVMNNQKITTLDISYYENFLSSSEHKRKPTSKENVPTNCTPKKSKLCYGPPISPMQRASLNSPRDRAKNTKEEEHARENKKITKKLNEKEVAIYELSYELEEKNKQIDQMTYQMQELNRKIIEMTEFKQRAEDCEGIQERCEELEKASKYYEEKYQKSLFELKELKELRECKQSLEKQIQTLTADNDTLEKKRTQTVKELTHLRDCEKELHKLQDINAAKEKEILQLLYDKGDLERRLVDTGKDFAKKKFELEELVENLTGEKAVLDNEFSCLKARLSQTEADKQEMLAQKQECKAQLTEELEHMQTLYDKTKADLEANVATLEQTIVQLRDESAQRENEKRTLESECDTLRDELQTSGKKLASSTTKVKELSDTIADWQLKYKQLESKTQTESAEMQAEASRLAKTLETKQTRLDELAQDVIKLRGDLKEKESRISSTEKEMSSVVGNLSRAEKNLSLMEKQRDEAVANGEREAQLGAQLKAKCDELESELRDKLKHVDKLNGDVQHLNNSLIELNGRGESWRFKMEQLEKQEAELREALVQAQAEALQKQKQLADVQACAEAYEKEYATLKNAYNSNAEKLDVVSKERQQLYTELTEKVKAHAELQLAYNQAVSVHAKESKQAEAQYRNMVKEAEFQIENLKMQMSSITKVKEELSEQLTQMQIRCRDEQVQLQAEVTAWKAKCQEKEMNMMANYRTETDKLVRKMNEREKVLMDELEQKNMECKRLQIQHEKHKDYIDKMDEHYKMKKARFEEAELALAEVKAKWEQAERELNELKKKVIQSETRNRTLAEELNLYKEKLKTLEYQYRNLQSQKDQLIRNACMGETFSDSSKFMTLSSLPPLTTVTSSATASYHQKTLPGNINSTPKAFSKSKKFLDDSSVNYSPESHTAEPRFEPTNSEPDFSRRFSMDSISKSSLASSRMGGAGANGTMMPPAFSRFSTISENEFEQPDINQKSFQIDTYSTRADRVSILKERNQQSKPHLQSSYALESMEMPAPDSRAVASRSNLALVANKKPTNGSSAAVNEKRKMDDTDEQKASSSKKPFMAGIKQSHI